MFKETVFKCFCLQLARQLAGVPKEKQIQAAGTPYVYRLVCCSTCQNYRKRTSNGIEIIRSSFLQS